MTVAEIVTVLTSARKEMGLQSYKLADEIGVDKRTVARWEHRLRSPNIKDLVAWADALGCDLEVRQRP